MSSPDVPPILTAEVDLALSHLHNPGIMGVVVYGPPGSGKSALLRTLREKLEDDGEIVLFASHKGEPMRVFDLVELLERAIQASPFADPHNEARHSQRGRLSDLEKIAAYLEQFSESTPVLMIDGLDEADHGSEILSALELLTVRLPAWRFVVSLRTFITRLFWRLPDFQLIELRPRSVLTTDPMISDLMTRLGPTLPPDLMMYRKAAAEVWLERLIAPAIASAPQPDVVYRVLEDLALAGHQESVTALAARSNQDGYTAHDLRAVLLAYPARELVDLEDGSSQQGTVRFREERVADHFRARVVLGEPFRIADLKVGSEEAERDDLLDQTFLQDASLHEIVTRHQR